MKLDGGAAEPDQITVPYSVANEGKVKYVADGDMLSWFDSITVSIRVEKTADPNKFGTTDVMVKNVTCARVTFVPSKLAPGETAQLSFKKVLDDGTLEDFPADQVFDVMIVGGGGNAGTLQSASGSGPVLTGTLAPVRYVAPAAIEGDSLVVQVAAFAYGSGGATLSVAQGKATPLLKKVPGLATTKAMSKKAQDSGMVALGKLLAESVCEAGQAVVKKEFPPCVDQVDYSGVQSTPESEQPRAISGCVPGFDRGGTTVSWWEDDAGQPLKGPPLVTALCNAGGNCVRLGILAVNAFIEWGYCETNVKELGTPVDSEFDIASGDIATARQAVAAFNDQIKRLEEIITAYTIATKQGQTEYLGDFPTLNNEFYSVNGILAHERSHRDRAYLRIKGAVDKVAKENTECLSANLTAREKLQKESVLIEKLVDSERRLRSTGKNINELVAHIEEKQFLKKLVKRIEDKFHL